MLRFKFTISVMMCLLLACSSSFGADDTKSAKPDKKAKAEKGDSKKAAGNKGSLIRGYYAIIASEIKLTDDQRSKLEAALQARADGNEAWEKSNGDKDSKLSDAIKEAKTAKDKDKAKSLSDEQKKLRAERDKVDEQFKSKFDAILTGDQKTHLAGFSLYMGTMLRLSKAKPTDEQKAKAKTMALEAAKTHPAGGDDKAEKEFRAAFAEKAAQAVLTAEQREALTKKTEKKPE